MLYATGLREEDMGKAQVRQLLQATSFSFYQALETYLARQASDSNTIGSV